MVDHQLLFQKLTKIGVSTQVKQGIQMMFNNLTVQAGNEFFHIGRGLGQGWGISCLLFNIFTDDLTDNLLA